MTVEQLERILAPGVVEAEAVEGHVPGHGGDAPGDFGVETVAELAPQPLEAVVAQHVTLDPVVGPAPARTHYQHHVCLRQAPQHSLSQGRAEEPRGAGDGDAPAGKHLAQHPLCLSRQAPWPTGPVLVRCGLAAAQAAAAAAG